MRPVVVLWLKFCQQEQQSLGAIPGLAAQPAFESEYEPFRNAVAFWAMAKNRNVDEIGFLDKVGECLGAEMLILVTDQEFQFFRQDSS